MRYKISSLFLFFMSLVFLANAQSFSLSPYSKFGIGDLTYSSYQPGISMGYTGIALRSSRFVNELNPAANTAIDTLTFISDISLMGRMHSMKNSLTSNTTTNTDISFFGVGFPLMKRWGITIGLNPISNVGYNITSSENIDTLASTSLYHGNGGLNEVFIGNGFKVINYTKSNIVKNVKINHFHSLSIGVKSSYIFGSLDKYSTIQFPNETYVYDLYKTERTIIHDVAFRLGIQYNYLKQEVSDNEKTDKFGLTLGFTLDNENKLNAKQTTLTTKYLNLLGYVTNDTIQNTIDEKGNIVTPLSLGFGIAMVTNDKFTWAADVRMQQWSKSTFFNVNEHLRNTLFIGSGIQIIPDPQKYYTYFKMINYRLGAYYNQTYLQINNTNINEMGITFGLGLPISKTDKGESTMIRRKLPPMLNLAFSYGIRGTTSNNLIKEQFFQFSVGLNIQDIWFIKRKYN